MGTLAVRAEHVVFTCIMPRMSSHGRVGRAAGASTEADVGTGYGNNVDGTNTVQTKKAPPGAPGSLFQPRRAGTAKVFYGLP